MTWCYQTMITWKHSLILRIRTWFAHGRMRRVVRGGTLLSPVEHHRCRSRAVRFTVWLIAKNCTNKMVNLTLPATSNVRKHITLKENSTYSRSVTVAISERIMGFWAQPDFRSWLCCRRPSSQLHFLRISTNHRSVRDHLRLPRDPGLRSLLLHRPSLAKKNDNHDFNSMYSRFETLSLISPHIHYPTGIGTVHCTPALEDARGAQNVPADSLNGRHDTCPPDGAEGLQRLPFTFT